jgi:uncharacterized protein YndB with AHSA1/START domain
MTSSAGTGNRLLGTLRAENGRGVVRMEDRFDTDIDDAWSALTEPSRLARWIGEVAGDLRLGGEYRYHFYASGAEGTGRVEVREPPRRLLLSHGTDEPPAYVIEVTLTADGGQTVLVVEEKGMPLHQLAGYGAGIQVHVEGLGAHLAGREHGDTGARWDELQPRYEELAAKVG